MAIRTTAKLTATLMICLLLTLTVEAGATLDKCRAKINGSDGTVLVAAQGVTGTLLWGDAAGSEVNTFFASCVTGDVAKDCMFGAAGSLAGITPPSGCTVYLKDSSSTCSAFIKKCTPGVRDLAAVEARLDALEPASPSTVNRIFATTATPNGAFGGLAGGDAICAAAAASAGLHGTWIAWLSDSSTNAIDRLDVNSGPFLTMDGFLIASNKADLTDGTLANSITRNEFSGTAAAFIWTGTLTNGTSGGGNCSDWTSTGGSGMTGVTGSTSGSWTQNGGGSVCSAPSSLFCIEQ